MHRLCAQQCFGPCVPHSAHCTTHRVSQTLCAAMLWTLMPESVLSVLSSQSWSHATQIGFRSVSSFSFSSSSSSPPPYFPHAPNPISSFFLLIPPLFCLPHFLPSLILLPLSYLLLLIINVSSSSLLILFSHLVSSYFFCQLPLSLIFTLIKIITLLPPPARLFL